MMRDEIKPRQFEVFFHPSSLPERRGKASLDEETRDEE
jgi:hypothetical protein